MTPTHEMPKTYFDLVRQLPLVKLQSDEDLEAAQGMIDDLLRRELDRGQDAYLEVLASLVTEYEKEFHPIPDATEADVLQLLMESNHLTQVDLAKKVGMAASTVSEVLSETRSLTKKQILKLADLFKVSPAVFLPRQANN